MTRADDYLQTTIMPLIQAWNMPDAVAELKRFLAAGGSLDDMLRAMREGLAAEADFGPLYYAYILMAGLMRRGNALQAELQEHMNTRCFERFGKMYHENRDIFAQSRWYGMNRQLFFDSLRGLGVGNYENAVISGEDGFLRSVLAGLNQPVIFDVGANVGKYASSIKSINNTARVFAFEPHPTTFTRLKEAARKAGFAAFNFGLSDKDETTTLYDRGDHPEGSSHASMYAEVIESLHHIQSVGVQAVFRAFDDMVKDLDITRIDLLKVDTEGHELAVLRGAHETLAAGMIDRIHFEFNEMNVVSRSFLRDFYSLLPDYNFYRMLPDALVALGDYGPPVFMELFMYQNIVAVRKGVDAAV